MALTIGQKAPEFSVTALVGREFKQIHLSDYKGKWVVLYFYPMDFTFVCPTEIVEFDRNVEELADRNAVLLGGSTDTEYSHLGWVKSHPDLAALKHPLFADVTKRMARDYGVLLEDKGVALRGTFLIDPNGDLRWISIYDLGVGRNVGEVIRVLDALQTDGLCPCNWKKGEDTIQV
jgi:peroxiredoxin (alkyl hydroperoxide reductase subunit C)